MASPSKLLQSEDTVHSKAGRRREYGKEVAPRRWLLEEDITQEEFDHLLKCKLAH